MLIQYILNYQIHTFVLQDTTQINNQKNQYENRQRV